MSKKRVYVVTSGEYSDFRIEGIFTTRKKAILAKALIIDSNDVEERVLDEATPPIGRGLDLFTVRIKKDGIHKVFKEGYITGDYISKANNKKCIPFNWDKSMMECYIWARDEQHARKIANERRAMILASGLWGKSNKEIRQLFEEMKE